MSDEINLEHATLFCDSASGVYIPQRFAKEVNRAMVTGIGEDDYKVLEAGPDHENYWDAWADVLDNASIQDPKVGECYLHQDGDLWVVPVEKEEEKPETIKVLGHTFRLMKDDDYDGFAGADEGSYIGDINEPHAAVLIYSPSSKIISEIPCDPDIVGYQQHDWQCVEIC